VVHPCPGPLRLLSNPPEGAFSVFDYPHSTAAQIIADKYEDHLPHYRQSQRFRRRHDIDIGRQTLNTWTHATARHLAPINRAIRKETRGTVVTGDKRALISYKNLSSAAQRIRLRVVCWEQLLLRVHQDKGYDALREGCCEGIECDKLLSLAFSNGLATEEEHAIAAIESYLRGVENHSSDILLRFD